MDKKRKRLGVDPTTFEQRVYTTDELEFMMAVDQYKRDNRRPYPSWSEVLEVLRSLGYRKVAEPGPIPSVNKMAPHTKGPTAD